MTPEEQRFLRDFFRALSDRPLDPDDPAYVGLYEDPALDLEDPVDLLSRSIEWAPSNTSAQLLSGFRGAGKSTELRRLRRDLTEAGYLVLLFDVGDYLSPSAPIDISDFVIVVAGALSDELDELGVLPRDAKHEGYWTRLQNFMATRVEFKEMVGKAGPVSIKANLRTDPTFRRRLQEHAAGHLAELVSDMREYVQETVNSIPPDALGEGLVLIADSIENISGTITNAVDVQESLERLFTSQAANLHLPGVHVVYTVPPWLKIRAPGIGARFSGGMQMLHPLTIRTPDDDRAPQQPSLDALCRVVSARGPWEQLLGERDVLDRLALESGGHLRDLLRVLSEIVRRAKSLPVDALTVQRALAQVKSELLPIAIADARWLQRIAETHDASLEDIDRLQRFVTFLDSLLVLCYRSDDNDWYDVHPLVRDEVRALAATPLAPAAVEEASEAAPA